MAGVILGNHETAAGIFIETMNNSGPRHSADAAQLPAAMMQQGIDQRVFAVPCSGMNDHARRFIEHDDVVILEKNFERQIFRLCPGRRGLGMNDGNYFASPGMMGRPGGFPVNPNIARSQQPLNGAAGKSGKFPAQKNVQSFERKGLLDDELPVLHASAPRSSRTFVFAASASFFHESNISSPTPVQIALSAILKAGKPISSPLRRMR